MLCVYSQVVQLQVDILSIVYILYTNSKTHVPSVADRPETHPTACYCVQNMYFSCSHVLSVVSYISLQANGARDALAKGLYIRTVVAIMRRINTLLRGVSQKSHGGGAKSHHTPSQDTNVLHVVDMFGFENCEVRVGLEGGEGQSGGR